jgi:hypothetical protein
LPAVGAPAAGRTAGARSWHRRGILGHRRREPAPR